MLKAPKVSGSPLSTRTGRGSKGAERAAVGRPRNSSVTWRRSKEPKAGNRSIASGGRAILGVQFNLPDFFIPLFFFSLRSVG